MVRFVLVGVLVIASAGCAPTSEQQAAAFSPTATALAERTRQARRFDTPDINLMLRASIGVLQDLGYVAEETQTEFGVIVASKFADGRIRAQIVVKPTADRRAVVVRANFQRVLPGPGATLARGEVLTDATIYQGFFEKLAQSVFLTAHEI
jgi:hypothetical protein